MMIINNYDPEKGNNKKALLINPPVYDSRYWDRWGQPYGLLRVGALLRKRGYLTGLIDCLESNPNGHIKRRKKSMRTVGDIQMPIWNFGMTLTDLQNRLNSLGYIPDKVFITSIMTYWWESTRDVVNLVKKTFPKTETLVGGIYPTLCPDHADVNIDADIIVSGEVYDASDLWSDLSLYPKPPDYAVITASRGCPYDCAHCAQREINGIGVRHREPEDVVEEIIHKNKKYGIHKFAFYEDNILINCENNFERIIDLLLERDLRFHFSAPEGFEVRLLYPRLLRKMKEVGFRSIYLPLEIASLDKQMQLDQKAVQLDEFLNAVRYCKMAGYRPGTRQDLNAFILFGVPNQPLELLIEAILYAVHIVGNVTPMLFTPVPGSRIYQSYEWYFKKKGLQLEDLNGKFFPFWELSGVKPTEYIDIKRFMYAFHTQLHGKAFDLLGKSKIPHLVREAILNYDQRNSHISIE